MAFQVALTVRWRRRQCVTRGSQPPGRRDAEQCPSGFDDRGPINRKVLFEALFRPARPGNAPVNGTRPRAGSAKGEE
jgi:hypothetical protein